MESGEITFSDSKWLMFLIHWGPIQTQKISADYVKQRMSKMWGVNFEFSGESGEMSICGHPAAWAEAYGTNRSFYTRFIIWNCAQSQREFIADTNYNIRMKTPKTDFELERLSAKTLACHQGQTPGKSPELTKLFSSEKYGFSFYLPEKWFIFDSPFYVPFPEYSGIRDQKMGSLLGLPSDQNITITLKWYPLAERKEEMVMGIDQKILQDLQKEISSQAEVQSAQNTGMESFAIGGKKIYRIWGVYQIKNLSENEKSFYTGDGIYQVDQWDLKEKGKRIVVILKTRKFMYQTFTSSPSRHFQDQFFQELLSRIH